MSSTKAAPRAIAHRSVAGQGPGACRVRRLAWVAVGSALALGACRDKSASSVGAPAPSGDEGGAVMAALAEATVDQRPAVAEPIAEDDGGGTALGWATWPMPNSPVTGLPNPQDYDTSAAGVTVDRVTGLMWQRYPSKKTSTFLDAKSDCARLSLGGYDDWRLPSRIELVSIVDLTRSQPSIHPVAFPRTPSDWFWTRSVATDSPNEAWYVYFYFGYPKTDDKSNTFSVRCVRTPSGRAASAPAETHYSLQAETVRDVATGLTWQRAVPPTKLAFEAARTYCERLRLGGQTGWRVPSMPELLTLVDDLGTAPVVDRAAFPKTPADSFWTSSTFAETASQAWHVYFDRGNALYGLLKAPYFVRCVR